MSNVVTTGPLFSATRDLIIETWLSEAVERVAEHTEDLIHDELGHGGGSGVLRHPTGHYNSQVRSDVKRHNAVVHDSGVIYGPWLEGTSRRNQETRFKGYSTFRRMAQRAQDDVPDVVDRRKLVRLLS